MTFNVNCVLLVVMVSVLRESYVDSVTYTYANETQWPIYAPVCASSTQSPIDLLPTNMVLNGTNVPLTFTNYGTQPSTTEFDISNTGLTVQIKVSSSDITKNITISGGGLPATYSLFMFHFHWGSTNDRGSEHTVNGLPYPMELHLVHYDTKYPDNNTAGNNTDGVAALAVFVQIGPNNNTFFDELILYFQNVAQPGQVLTMIPVYSLNLMLPTNINDYYRYRGSYAYPPCFNSVVWTIFNQPIYISQSQLTSFRTILHELDGVNGLMEDNFRPTQPLNGRPIYKTFNTDPILPSTAAPTSATSTNASPATTTSGQGQLQEIPIFFLVLALLWHHLLLF